MPDISTDKVCYLVLKTREIDVNEGAQEPDRSAKMSDPGELEVLQDISDDPTYQEIKTFVDDLNEDEQIALVALMWLGRGDYTTGEWDEAREEARRARDEHGHTADYLLGAPLVGDYLEEGLSLFDESCEEMKAIHL